LAIVLQEPFIFPYTVAENIAYGRPGASAEQIDAAAGQPNADAFIRRLAEGYNSIIGERGATLSGGEKQRLFDRPGVRQRCADPDPDEPTSALDAQTEAKLLEALDRLMEGRHHLHHRPPPQHDPQRRPHPGGRPGPHHRAGTAQ